MDHIDRGILQVLVWTEGQSAGSEPELEFRMKIQNLYLSGREQIVRVRINSELTMHIKLMIHFVEQNMIIGSSTLTQREYLVLLSEFDISRRPLEIFQAFNLKIESTN